MKKRFSIIVIVMILIFLLVMVIKPSLSKKHRPSPITAIEVAQPVNHDEPLFFRVPGMVDAAKTVTLRSKVTGFIKTINFKQGKMVNANALLFQIDPASFIADLKQVQADLLKDQAQSAALSADKTRYFDLYKKGFSSKQRYDQAVADFTSNLAEMTADKAIIEQKRVALADTKITTPIAGKTGNVTVKTGDLVSANDTILVVVNQLSPIFVNFYLTPTQLNTLMPFYQNHTINTSIYSENGDQLLSKGTLTFIDNTIDSSSGTVLLKATVTNTNHRLWPGQSVVVTVIVTIKRDELVIPARAVRTDQKGDFVYVVKQGHVFVQPITVDRQIDDRAIIAKGLSVDDTIATVFPPGLKNGAHINIVPSPSQQAS